MMTAQACATTTPNCCTHGSGAPDYDSRQSYALPEPIAPHLAAANAGVTIELRDLARLRRIVGAMAQCVVVEGVGGWPCAVADADAPIVAR